MNKEILAEQIQLLPGESFRLLKWSDNVRDVEAIAVDGTCHSFTGSGDKWHYHSQMELTLVTKGSGTRFAGDSIAHFDAVDLTLIGRNLPHYWHGLHRSSGYAIQFDFDPEHLFWQIPETQAARALWKDAQHGIHFTGDTVTNIAEMMKKMTKCGGMGRFGLFIQILELLTKTPKKNRKIISSRTFTPPASQATYSGIQKAIKLVFQKFHEDMYINDVLLETGMSKATFERQFKKHTGKTFTRFVTEVRLNFASRKLIETGLTVAEIAFESGFNNLSHFNHKFIELHKQSPRAFRKKMTRAA